MAKIDPIAVGVVRERDATIKQLRDTLKFISCSVVAFDRRCKADEYTDTGEAWELLHNIGRRARAAVRIAEG